MENELTADVAPDKPLEPLCFICGNQLNLGNPPAEDPGVKVNLERFAVEYLLKLVWKGKVFKRYEEVVGGCNGLCGGCTDMVRQAKDLYLVMLEVVRQFRTIQQRVVTEVGRSKAKGSTSAKRRNWRRLITNKQYKFSGAFVVPPPKQWMFTESSTGTCADPPGNCNRNERGGRKAPSNFQIGSGAEDNFGQVTLKHEVLVNEASEGYGDDSNSYSAMEDNFQDDDNSTDPITSSSSNPVPNLKRKGPLSTQQKKRCRILAEQRKLRKNQHTCDICGEILTPTEMTDHMREHVGDEYLRQCPNGSCSFVFPHVFALRKHLMFRRTCYNTVLTGKQAFSPGTAGIRQKRFPCESCGVNRRSMDALLNHLDQQHENKAGSAELIPCPISGCPKSYRVRQRVEVHLALDHTTEVSSVQVLTGYQGCRECERGVRIPLVDMEEHLKTAHNAQAIFRCTHCPQLFSSREHLFIHVHECHRKSRHPYSCDICAENFGNRDEWREHYRKEHQIEFKYICDTCGVTLCSPDDLARHRRVHLTFSCDLCENEGDGESSKLFSYDRLKLHKSTFHGLNLYKCSQCTSTFKNSADRTAHFRTEHEGIRGPFICSEPDCGKVFKTESTLKTHRIVHKKDRKMLVCPECGKGLACGNSFRQHMNSVHLGLKPFICETCGECFKTRGGLRTHLERHH